MQKMQKYKNTKIQKYKITMDGRAEWWRMGTMLCDHQANDRSPSFPLYQIEYLEFLGIKEVSSCLCVK